MVNSNIAKKIFLEIYPLLNRMGNNNPRQAEKQSLYGDILDWLRDTHSELRDKEYDDHVIAMYIIVEYITTTQKI